MFSFTGSFKSAARVTMLAWALFHLASVLLADGKGTPIQRYASGSNSDYDTAVNFLWENDVATSKIANKGAIAAWNYASNLTEHNKKLMVSTISLYKSCIIRGLRTVTADITTFSDHSNQRCDNTTDINVADWQHMSAIVALPRVEKTG